MKVKDAMHEGVKCAGPDTPIVEIAKMMRDFDVGSIPVCDNGRLAGMVTDRDIVCRGVATGADCTAVTAHAVMSAPMVYCSTEEEVEDALHIMEKNQIRRLPVVGEGGALAGMLAIGDISKSVGRDLTGGMMRSLSAHH